MTKLTIIFRDNGKFEKDNCNKNMEKLLTVSEVANILGLKPPRIYEMTRSRQIPFVLLGAKQYRYSERKISDWIENGGNQKEEEQTKKEN